MNIPPALEQAFTQQRAEMVARHIAGRGVQDEAVLSAMSTVERHRFVPPVDWDEAYADHPLGIDCRQTISQPYIVAYMTQALAIEPEMSVLEIGTGSGYQTAILAAMGAQVFSVERHARLSQQAADALTACGLLPQVQLHVGDGSCGWAAHAPYDRILVTAAAPDVPASLLAQLAEGGRMVIPVGEDGQVLSLLEKRNGTITQQEDLPVIFVPLLGEEGFSARD